MMNLAINGNDMTVAQSSRLENLEFIHEMLAELRRMAEAERCDMLGYLINMAKIESGDTLTAMAPR